MPDQELLFPETRLPEPVRQNLRDMNPWWRGDVGPSQPLVRRHLVAAMRRRLEARLAPIVVVRGSRQIGKTTAQLQLVQDLLAEGLPPTHVLRVQWDDVSLPVHDDPILAVTRWYQTNVLGSSLNAAAAEHTALLVFDEVQNLTDWAPQLKFLVDHHRCRVVVTGSSALRIAQGQDSLAGRVSVIEAGTFSLTEIGRFHGLPLGDPALPDNGLGPLLEPGYWRGLRDHGRDPAALASAFDRFSRLGGYPIAHVRPEAPWPLVADQLNENVIRRVIRHDLRTGQRGRKRDAALLEAVFRLACRYVGQAPACSTLAREIRAAELGNVGEQRVRVYISFLAESLLLRTIDPLEIRLRRQRHPPKLVLTDHALRASWLHEEIPLQPGSLAQHPHLCDLAGHVAESVVGAVLASINGLDMAWLPERSEHPEIDYVVSIGTHRIPIAVKYRRQVDPGQDLAGLVSFLDQKVYEAPCGILVTQPGAATTWTDERIIGVPLDAFMLLR